MPRHLYLRKANDDLVSHCRCAKEDALISSPGQADCPWCGCGWLFICSRCRKAFTFAEAIEAHESWEEAAERSIRSFQQREPEPRQVEEWVGAMKVLLKDIQLGERYVYFDGWVIPTTADGIYVEGWHSRHELDLVPQVAALAGATAKTELLTLPAYWHSTALPPDDEA